VMVPSPHGNRQIFTPCPLALAGCASQYRRCPYGTAPETRGLHASLRRPQYESARFHYFSQVLSERWPRPLRIPAMLDVSGDTGFLAERFSRLGFRVTAAGGLAGDLAAPGRKFDAACCCDRLEQQQDWQAVVGRIAPMVRTGGVFFYSVVGRPRRGRSPVGRVWEWFGAPRRDYAITLDQLAATLRRAGFRVREAVGLGHDDDRRMKDGPVSYIGYAFRLSDRPRLARAESRSTCRAWDSGPLPLVT
jgi:SAM-dependent methyltransferase